jgi:hypothetical protein
VVKANIWFNRNLSSTAHVIVAARDLQRADEEFRFIVSHTRADHPSALVADLFEPEPNLPGEQYLAWCLDFVERHKVDVFIPREKAATISGAKELFRQRGTRLVSVAKPETLDVIKSKALLYEAIPHGLVPLPEYRVVRSADEFVAACEDLRKRHKVCYKPTMDMAGNGFHIVSFDGWKRYSSWTGQLMTVDYPEAVAALTLAGPFREQMVLQYLDGPETSIDCLAENGVMHVAIPRVKSSDGASELLADNQEVIEYSRRLTELLNLSGMFNVQFKESQGKPYLLEINARTSGGLHYGFASGVCIPYWAIRLALGTATGADIPLPKLGIRVQRRGRDHSAAKKANGLIA